MLDWRGLHPSAYDWGTESDARRMHAEYCDPRNGLQEVAASNGLTVSRMYDVFRAYGLDTAGRRKAKNEAKRKNEARKSV